MPRTVAVVGASTDRTKFGNKAVRAYVQRGWEVYPIHPHAREIEGLQAFAQLADVPAVIQRVTLYLPPEIGITLLPEIAAAQPEEFFINPGAESDALVERAEELGLAPVLACSIIEIGESPNRYA